MALLAGRIQIAENIFRCRLLLRNNLNQTFHIRMFPGTAHPILSLGYFIELLTQQLLCKQVGSCRTYPFEAKFTGGESIQFIERGD